MLFTKLHRPQVSREHVYRNHLIVQLDKNLYKPFTLVSAGAGYGKSMLVSSWLEKSNIPFAWLSLSDEDNDLRIFINGISTSLRKKKRFQCIDAVILIKTILWGQEVH